MNFFDSVSKSMQQHDESDISLRFKEDILEKSYIEAKRTKHFIDDTLKMLPKSVSRVEEFIYHASFSLGKMAENTKEANKKALESTISKEMEATINDLLEQARHSFDHPD